MEKFHVELTEEEGALVGSMQLHVPEFADVHDIYTSNADKVVELVDSLLGRGAIPEVRMRYWTDPEYCTAPGKSSHAGIFARNGGTDHEIYKDLRFLPYLRYFLFGCELPNAAVEEFQTGLAGQRIRPEWFTSGDHDPMWRLARKVTRKHGLEKRWAAEEFLKLCLDLGFDIDVARSVRNAVMQVR